MFSRRKQSLHCKQFPFTHTPMPLMPMHWHYNTIALTWRLVAAQQATARECCDNRSCYGHIGEQHHLLHHAIGWQRLCARRGCSHTL